MGDNGGDGGPKTVVQIALSIMIAIIAVIIAAGALWLSWRRRWQQQTLHFTMDDDVVQSSDSFWTANSVKPVNLADDIVTEDVNYDERPDVEEMEVTQNELHLTLVISSTGFSELPRDLFVITEQVRPPQKSTKPTILNWSNDSQSWNTGSQFQRMKALDALKDSALLSVNLFNDDVSDRTRSFSLGSSDYDFHDADTFVETECLPDIIPANMSAHIDIMEASETDDDKDKNDTLRCSCNSLLLL